MDGFVITHYAYVHIYYDASKFMNYDVSNEIAYLINSTTDHSNDSDQNHKIWYRVSKIRATYTPISSDNPMCGKHVCVEIMAKNDNNNKLYYGHDQNLDELIKATICDVLKPNSLFEKFLIVGHIDHVDLMPSSLV